MSYVLVFLGGGLGAGLRHLERHGPGDRAARQAAGHFQQVSARAFD